MMIIDPPSPFAPKPEWEEFRKEMLDRLANDPDNQQVKDALSEAEEALSLL